ncbi:saccharopine dehydrogenase family protein [Legionella parisiensis]|uniref:Putative trans-acting enoyl reductase n=1 Tax=Legionella parisiensis TaxID=45071 RepID=A0A1E5JU73_9GAMM|nr:saccharopine dehydrogenase NADP-binding domain-containing protein [Legionella parisiensis]KTD40284.1 saccharopine dehydrogenase [Legionella parisiensis]OEH47618.1 putative trans-acting enoyl reductase [Legionella parisiensis]STX77284.1 saccharopine dehydrogenase [Legionella parisiensis]
MKKNFLIYGSYGYTGNLIAQLSVQQGLKPVLAGRDAQKLKLQARALNLEYRVFDVNDLEQTKKALKDLVAVIHCAGPFKYTYKNMVLACLAVKTHYLDITGEVRVIEQLMAMNEQAQAAGIMLLPGSGFDVVPSDCLTSYLKQCLPDANNLVLAIGTFNKGNGLSISHGTAKTMMEDIPEGTLIRDGGVLKKVPFCWKTRFFDFGTSKKLLCATISWGDLASAWWSTQIPHIEIYMALPKKIIQLRSLINPFKKFLAWSPIKKYVMQRINQLPSGPTEEHRQNSVVKIYAEVSNEAGKKIAALMTTPNGYTFTALSTLMIIQHALAGNAPIGFQTPSSAYTEDLVMKIPEVTRVMIQ